MGFIFCGVTRHDSQSLGSGVLSGTVAGCYLEALITCICTNMIQITFLGGSDGVAIECGR